MAATETWEGLKREARALEATLEARVEAFGRIDAEAARVDEGERRAAAAAGCGRVDLTA